MSERRAFVTNQLIFISTLNEIPQPLGKLKGKVAVITGGTTGIGLAAAKLFVREGAYVFITGRRQTELDQAVRVIGSNVTGIQGDVAKLADLDRLYETVKAEGRIDIVFANAGLAEFSPLVNITEEHFDRLFTLLIPFFSDPTARLDGQTKKVVSRLASGTTANRQQREIVVCMHQLGHFTMHGDRNERWDASIPKVWSFQAQKIAIATPPGNNV